MRRLFVITFLMLTPLIARPVHAAGCQCAVTPTKDLADAATYVFNGEVWDVEIDRNSHKKVIIFDVDDTFKGKPSNAKLEMNDNEDGKECATDFHEGETYLVYARWQWGAMLTSRCWGTKKIQDAAADTNTLGASGSLKAKYYDKLQVYCMGRPDTPCCLSSLKAMREGGYLPQPETGCPDETIPDRLRCEGSYLWCVPTLEPSRHNQP